MRPRSLLRSVLAAIVLSTKKRANYRQHSPKAVLVNVACASEATMIM
jgi:hypothetical protein